MTQADQSEKTSESNVDDRTLRLLINALHDLQYGQVTAIVQDGVVVQIERTEKRRTSRKARHEK